MAKTKLNLKYKSDAELRQLAEAHKAAITGNATFPTPSPNATDFDAALTSFISSLADHDAAQQAAKQATAAKEVGRANLEAVLTARASYVDLTCSGDEAKILSSGFDVRAPVAPVGDLEAPLDVLASMGKNASEIVLTWSPVKGAVSYVVDCKVHNTPAPWEQAKICTRARISITGLTSGTVYSFRVRAIGSAGESPWSDETVKLAP